MSNQFSVKSTQTVYEVGGSAPLEVLASQVVTGTGVEELWHTVRVNHGIPGTVIVAVQQGRVLVAREWRLTVNNVVVGFPRGRGMDGEVSEQTALRELREETGLAVTSATVLARLHADTGTLQDEIAVVYAEVTEGTSPTTPDRELLGWQWVEAEVFDEMVSSCRISDGITLAAWAIARGRVLGISQQPQ